MVIRYGEGGDSSGGGSGGLVVAYMAVAIGGASRQAHRGEGGQGGVG